MNTTTTFHPATEIAGSRLLRDHAPQIADDLLARHQEREHASRVLAPMPRRIAPPDTLAERMAARRPEPAGAGSGASMRALLLILCALFAPLSVGALVFGVLRQLAGARVDWGYILQLALGAIGAIALIAAAWLVVVTVRMARSLRDFGETRQ